jgi:hypothetical protein
MRDPLVRERRRAMLDEPHVRPLLGLVADLRRRRGAEVPNFDPLDGGVEARLLFLFEKPGPMTDPGRPGVRAGSGFVSRNNDDATAEATWHFMAEAGIPREATLTWNAIPWWNGTVAIGPDELGEGLAATAWLLGLLPGLRGVVLVGKKAGRARAFLGGTGLHVATSPHPSPRVRAGRPAMWRTIGGVWREAAHRVGCAPG